MNENRLDGPLKWCKDREAGLPLPVVSFPERVTESEPSAKRYPARFKSNVYVLQAGDFYKIGVAKNIETRVDELQIGCPYEIKVLHAWSTFLPYGLERRLHFRLRRFHYRGEWFKMPKPVLAELLAHEPTI